MISREFYSNEYLRLSDKDLLAIFPEVKQIIPDKILELKSLISEKEKDIEESLQHIKSLHADEFTVFFLKKIIEVFQTPELLEWDRQLRTFQRFQNLINPKNKYIEKFSEKLEQARIYPIQNIVSQVLDLKVSGENYIALCPFHNEKSPSFYLYTKSNSYHCFGCGAHGDVINLTQHLFGVGFKEAVEMLQK